MKDTFWVAVKELKYNISRMRRPHSSRHAHKMVALMKLLNRKPVFHLFTLGPEFMQEVPSPEYRNDQANRLRLLGHTAGCLRATAAGKHGNRGFVTSA